MAICSHMTDRQPTVTSETRSAGLSYPIMSGMLTVTGLGLFLLSVASAKSPAYREPSSLFLFFPPSPVLPVAFSLPLLPVHSVKFSALLQWLCSFFVV